MAILCSTGMLARRIFSSLEAFGLCKSRLCSMNAALASAALLAISVSCHVHDTMPLLTETDGSYVRLPNKSNKAVVWGDNPDAVKSLKTWLIKQHLTLVDDVKINQLAKERRLPQPIPRSEILKLAKDTGSTQVIFVDADIYESEAKSLSGAYSVYKASLNIRGLNADTGDIDWTGKATSTEPFKNLAEGIHRLTCHALATAWGFQKPGTATAASVCLPGQDVMVFTDPATARYILATAKAFRTVYAKQIVAQAGRTNVKPDENWTKDEHAIMLPAQFLKAAGRELDDFELSLIGLNPIYKENLPKTKAEEEALRKLVLNPATEVLTFEDGNQFKGLAVDIAIADSCVACHNTHPTSPKRDFKKGDVMGAIVVRFSK